MKNVILATLLSFLLAFASAENVAELRRLRALGWHNGGNGDGEGRHHGGHGGHHGGNGHHFGGDNGRDHPNKFNNNGAEGDFPVPAPYVSSDSASADPIVPAASPLDEVPPPALIESSSAQAQALEEGSDENTYGCSFGGKAMIVIGVIAGLMLLAGAATFFCANSQTAAPAAKSTSAPVAAKGVPVPTKEQPVDVEEASIAEMTAASEPSEA